MDENIRKRKSYAVVCSAWLAVFCLFGYRSTFSVLLGPMAKSMNWTVSETSLGYSLMMSVYAITAFFSGMILDKWGTKPVYAIAAVFGMLGYYLTARVETLLGYYAIYAIFAGIATGMLWVSSTVSVRKWFIGKYYAKMWGLAFMGAPMAQVLLSLGVKQVLQTMDWRTAMTQLSFVVFVALLGASFLAKRSPEAYGFEAYGAAPATGAGAGPVKQEHIWSVKEAFGTLPIWGGIIAFLTSMLAEFLIWSQVVMFWTKDVKMSLAEATNMYVAIGIVGIFSMPLMGIVADKAVTMLQDEVKGRKVMLVFAPVTGAIACVSLMMTSASAAYGLLACVLFAIYWAIEPGGVVGYVGAIYGRVSLGKIWGLGTLIVMGIGPAVGSFMGGYLYDISGNYSNSIYFALCAFVVSAITAIVLPLTATSNKKN